MTLTFKRRIHQQSFTMIEMVIVLLVMAIVNVTEGGEILGGFRLTNPWLWLIKTSTGVEVAND